ncbi:hypothetical protein O1611_g2614 [Lasiodiplodia mahajangana]|uniref:Uncharacterized protein n=1 Tax=Lasiodiplodia mahajangana TaxID=1108764 RepID=A0ACC2JUD3_9PEZI|nr:hypothetical protein O1611_g2614 [Lasiodiplodia mahajangana]
MRCQRAGNPFKAQYDIGFDAPGPLVTKKPVHETIIIAAFILSKSPLPTSTTYDNLNNDQWEYFRGAVWNDDPSCYLFDDDVDDNHNFSTGAKWFKDFTIGDPSCMIQRSHFHDLQFLHSMGAEFGELPADTQGKILRWFEIMYKLACGNQGVSETDKLKQRLGEWFHPDSDPTDEESLRHLILSNTSNYAHSNIQRRALGICLHIITDSYAVGHTQRRLKNPGSYDGRDEDGFMRFKDNMWGDWGAIINFHCYLGQDSDLHSHYDGLEDAPLPSPTNLDSFNSIIGARNAIAASKKLIDFWADGTRWEDGVETFLRTEVFAIDPDATPSNSQVDQSGPISFQHRYLSSGDVDIEYQAGLHSKLTGLDARVLAIDNATPKLWRCFIWKVVLVVAILLFGTIVTLQSLRVYRFL